MSQERVVVAKVSEPSLKFLGMKGEESLSKLYEFEVDLVSTDSNIDVRSLLGTDLTLEIETTFGGKRYLSGKVMKFELEGREQATSEYFVYKATVVPNMWYLTKGKDYKIFQEMSIPDILKKVFDQYQVEYEFKTTGSYRNWEYVVQYEESPFNFVSRLMEHEGMYYWFKHEDGKNTVVIADDASAHTEAPEYEMFTYYDAQTNLSTDKESVFSWRHNAEITPSKYTVVDFDFRKPSTMLDTEIEDQLDGDENIEVYEWQGGYQELSDADSYKKLRLQALKVPQETIEAEATVRGVAPGYTFTLANHPRQKENDKYLVLSAKYDMQDAGYSTGTQREDRFHTIFYCLPAKVQFRAPRVSREPKTHGPQTATVVGPAGEVLYTDKYGRVKVQFHWDRDGKRDENSSCWVRVSSPWASTGFGGLQIPRIGDEVVVDFIGGNPDRPLIIGRVYNEDNMPLVNLPDDARISGFRTRSVHGDSGQENFILFDDKLGKELLDMRAQMDMVLNVLNDLTITVGNNRTEDIGNNLKTTVGATEVREVQSTRTTDIHGLETGNYHASRNQTITGDQNTEVTANDTFKVGANQTTEITGDHTETITGNDTITVNSTRKETVTGSVDESYLSTYNQLVMGDVSVTDMANRSQLILGNDSNTTLGNRNHLLVGSKSALTVGSENESVIGSWNKTVLGPVSIFSPTSIDITAPSYRHISLFKHDAKKFNNKAYIFTGDAGIFKLGTAMLSVGIELGKIANYILADSRILTKFELMGLKIDNKIFELKKAALKVQVVPAYKSLVDASKVDTGGPDVQA